MNNSEYFIFLTFFPPPPPPLFEPETMPQVYLSDDAFLTVIICIFDEFILEIK